MQVNLLKKNGVYVDKKDGKEKNFTNFYLQCGDSLIPVEVCFFPDAETGKDVRYVSRKQILSAFADVLPEKEPKA